MLDQKGLKAYASMTDARLGALLPPDDGSPLFQAMRYSCLAPGKRLRPALALASARACGAPPEVALDAACAIEMVHCFSLIHDDLPAIDNDDLRRGRPTCHVQFGEAVALLAGDALFALSFETLAAMQVEPATIVACIAELAGASGVRGLVAGETLDVLSEHTTPSAEILERIHRQKTAVLIAASCAMGGLCACASPSAVSALRSYGEALGLAFQIADDLLNVTSTPEELGKAVGSDAERGKATYPSLFGVEASRARAHAWANTAIEHLSAVPGDTQELAAFAHFAVERLA